MIGRDNYTYIPIAELQLLTCNFYFNSYFSKRVDTAIWIWILKIFTI